MKGAEELHQGSNYFEENWEARATIPPRKSKYLKRKKEQSQYFVNHSSITHVLGELAKRDPVGRGRGRGAYLRDTEMGAFKLCARYSTVASF